MASPVRQLAIVLIVVGIVSAAPQKGRRKWRKPMNKDKDIASMISFDRLQQSGCVPEDFRAPDLSSCITPGGNIQATLQCIYTTMADAGGDEAFLSGLTDDAEWTSQQAELLAICDTMAHNLTAAQNQTFRVACWRGLAEFECRKQLLEDMGSAVADEEGGDIGEGLAYFMDSQCLHKGIKYGPAVEQIWANCSAQEGLNMEDLAAMTLAAYNLTAGVTGKPAEVNQPTREDVLGTGAMLQAFNSTLLCTMRAMGEVNADGMVDLEVMKANLAAAEGPEWLKGVLWYVADRCTEDDSTSYNDYMVCHFTSGPYACASIKSHMLAMGVDKRRSQRRNRNRNGRMCQRQGGRRGGRRGERQG